MKRLAGVGLRAVLRAATQRVVAVDPVFEARPAGGTLAVQDGYARSLIFMHVEVHARSRQLPSLPGASERCVRTQQQPAYPVDQRLGQVQALKGHI